MPAIDAALSELARAALAAAVFGCLQGAAGVAALARFRQHGRELMATCDGAPEPPPVSVLKPLHGDEPMLEAALTSIARQSYPGMQIVFGVQDPADPAIAVARRVMAAHPDRDFALVVDPTRHGGNGKVGNLINMLPAAKHALLVISDSDIHAPPGWLAAVVRTLTRPGVGLVTTIYHGRPARPGFAERLAAAQINHNFLPGNLLARWLGRQDCLGATMALHRDTLARVGGLPSLLGHVADDGVLGRHVRALGLEVALAPSVVATTVADPSIQAMLSHELRWGRTVRTQEPVGYALSVLQLPLAWASLAVLFAPRHVDYWTWLALVWGWRWLTTRATDLLAGAAASVPFWALPLRDWLSAAVMAGSFTSRRVAWRGQTLHIASSTMPGAEPSDPGVVDDAEIDRNATSPLPAAGLSTLGAAATNPMPAVLPAGSMRKTPV